MGLMRPPKPGSTSGGSSKPAAPGEWLTLYPAILEFLSMVSWPDGALRASGKIAVQTEYGFWKAQVNDNEGQRYAYLTATTPEELLDRLERGLTTGELDWRPSRPYVPRGGK